MITVNPVVIATDGFHGTYAIDVEMGMAYPLTDCCKAFGKGSGDGVVCRACYAPVDDRFGQAAEFGPTFTEQVARMMPKCENVIDDYDCAADLSWELESTYLRVANEDGE